MLVDREQLPETCCRFWRSSRSDDSYQLTETTSGVLLTDVERLAFRLVEAVDGAEGWATARVGYLTASGDRSSRSVRVCHNSYEEPIADETDIDENKYIYIYFIYIYICVCM